MTKDALTIRNALIDRLVGAKVAAVKPDFNSFPPFWLRRPWQRFELTWIYFCVRIF